MSVNEKIEQAIGELFSGNVWPLKCPHDSAPDIYAIYNPEIEEPGYYADDELRAITYSSSAAEKIAEILRTDQLEHTRAVSPERVQRRNDAVDSLRAAVITAYESGAFEK